MEVEELAEVLYKFGWRDTCDAQHDRLKQFLDNYTVTPIDPAKGCWCIDDGDALKPETCCIDDGKPENCIYSDGRPIHHAIHAETHNDCPHWKTPTSAIKE